MATFVLWKSTNDYQWHWHLKSDENNKVICWAEAYTTKQGALNSIEWVRKYAAGADLKEL
jgi:uncharacterized protein YegP (UPF0339 family)